MPDQDVCCANCQKIIPPLTREVKIRTLSLSLFGKLFCSEECRRAYFNKVWLDGL